MDKSGALSQSLSSVLNHPQIEAEDSVGELSNVPGRCFLLLFIGVIGGGLAIAQWLVRHDTPLGYSALALGSWLLTCAKAGELLDDC